MSKQTCPKCGSKDYVVSHVPAWMKGGPGTWTRCPSCDLPQPTPNIKPRPLPISKRKKR